MEKQINQDGLQNNDKSKIRENYSQKFMRTLKRPFQRRGVESKDICENYTMIVGEKIELERLQKVQQEAVKAFLYSKSTVSKQLAKSLFQRCSVLVDRGKVLTETCTFQMFSCQSELPTMTQSVQQLLMLLQPGDAKGSVIYQDSNMLESRKHKKMEWIMHKIRTTAQDMLQGMQDSLREQDDLIAECGHLIVKGMALLHMRTQRADFSGSGVAAGAAGIVAGAVVGAAGVLAAPATGGLSVPIFIAGKGLFVTGAATMAPSTVLLQRHNKQLKYLQELIHCLKSRLAIMEQRRDVLAAINFGCTNIKVNIQYAISFCEDAFILRRSPLEAIESFVLATQHELHRLTTESTIYLQDPSLFHYCYPECTNSETHNPM